jgi:hypothetical protein
MSTLFKFRGYKFYFYSNLENPFDPISVQVSNKKKDHVAKVSLDPKLKTVYSIKTTRIELQIIEKIIKENETLIRRRWNEHIGFL